jgi:general secretion pathway protein D
VKFLQRRTSLVLGLAIVGGGLLALPQGARAQDQEPADSERNLVFNFERASVRAFLGYLSREGRFTFIEEAAVTGDITALAENPLTRDEALEVLRAWLLPKDRTLLITGDVVRIVTLEEAQRRGLPVRVGSDPAGITDNDEIVTQVMPLRYVQAADVASNLAGLLSDRGTMMTESTSNSLVVRDTSASIRRFAQVLAALDQAVTAELQFKVYRLQNAQSNEVAQIIEELFSEGTSTLEEMLQGGGGGGGRGGRGGGRGGRGGGREQMMRMMMEGGGAGGGGGGSASAGRVNVSDDARTNSVVVTATSDQMQLIDALVAELDQTPTTVVSEIRAYQLANADAEELAATLTELFEEDSSSSSSDDNVPGFVRRMMGGGRGGRGGGGGEDGGGDEAGSNRYSPAARFTTDVRTNTLIVSATATDHAVVRPLIEELDRNPTETSAVLVIPLQNAEAETLSEVLTQVLAEQATATTNNAGGGRGGRNNRFFQQQAATPEATGGGGLVGEVTVVPDADSNALVITTNPRNFDRLRTIVSDLDRVRREVFIECLIAEVQLNDRGEMGIQWNAAFSNSLENAEEGTQSLGTDYGLDSLSDGLRYTTSSNDFMGLLRLLQTEGRLNILSSPKILVLDNGDAEISVGQEVPFVTNSRITQNGDTVNTIQYRDVGIILQVTPQINDDGYVRLVVHPEVSSIAPDSQSVTITEGVRSPTFNKNFADTTIVIRTGETAVIGGMIRDSLSETEFKIPILGDIPILGHIFKSTTREVVKQELVVFLTPHVVENAGQLRERSREVMSQYAYVPTEILNQELDRWLRGLEDESHAYHYNEGTVLLECGRITEAVDVLSEARDLRPQDAASRFNLALSLARAGRLEEAESELRQAWALDPRDAEIPYNLGAVLWRRGDYAQAVRMLEHALQLDPTHADARAWLPRASREAERVASGLLEREEPRVEEPASGGVLDGTEGR